LAKIDIIVFDKTGTLTQGKPSVTDVKAFDIDEIALLKLTAEAEVISEHHLGKTIVQEAAERGIQLIHEPADFTVEKGHGIYATIGSQSLIIGNRKLLQKNEIVIDKPANDYAIRQEKFGNTAIFVSIDHKVSGIISIADDIRPEAVEAITQLKANGLKKAI